MQYRNLGKTGLRVSALAMGCMCLPLNDPELAARTVDAAIAAGVNYFETARLYVSGRCQHLTAGGLKGRSRGLIVSGKAGIGPSTTAAGYRKEIELQMRILGVDYLEFFQVGWLDIGKLKLLTKKGGALEALEKARDEKLIGHIGFTGHDKPGNCIELIETGIFESLTLPYNLLDRSYEPAIRRAAELGVGVIAMGPVAGGILAAPSPSIEKLIPGGAATTTSAALRFVLANPGVSCACSGMGDPKMVGENVATANDFKGLTGEEMERMAKALDRFEALGKRFCTNCGYCKECPHGVNIPWNFELHNKARVYGLSAWAREAYLKMKPGQRADACTQCGDCEPKCPNRIPIRGQLAEVGKLFGAG